MPGIHPAHQSFWNDVDKNLVVFLIGLGVNIPGEVGGRIVEVDIFEVDRVLSVVGVGQGNVPSPFIPSSS